MLFNGSLYIRHRKFSIISGRTINNSQCSHLALPMLASGGTQQETLAALAKLK